MYSNSIDLLDLSIFSALRTNPLGTPKLIGAEVGASPDTVRSRIQRMKSNNFLRATTSVDISLLGKRERSEVEAAYSPFHLGLERFHVFFFGVRTSEQFDKLTQLAELHPYTHYRVLTLAFHAIYYMQFDLPIGASNLFLKLLDSMQELDFFDNYRIINTEYLAKSQLDLSLWEPYSQQWNISAKNTLAKNPIIDIWNEFNPKGIEIDAYKTTSVMNQKLDLLDAKLLRELSVNAKCTASEIANIYGKNVSTITRRLTKLKEHIISNYVLHYNRRVFDLVYPQIIFGEVKTTGIFSIDRALQFISSGAFPFDSIFVSDGRNFLWYSTTPPSYAPMISEFVWRMAKNIHVLQLQMNTARTYYFYHENYLGNRKWRIDEDYIVNIPLNGIL